MLKVTPYQSIPISLCIIGILTTFGCAGGGSDGSGTPNSSAGVACGPIRDIYPTSTTNGSLASSDCMIEALFAGSGELTFVALYRVTLPSRGKLTIHMSSIQFHSYLVLLQASLQLPEIATDDDSGGGTDDLISRNLDAGT